MSYTNMSQVKEEFLRRCKIEGKAVSSHIRMDTDDTELIDIGWRIGEGFAASRKVADEDWIVPVDGSRRYGYVKWGVNENSIHLPNFKD